MKIVALLPMKANSERVKGKNFRDLGGKPLFRWILDTLLSVPAISQVVINTDAREILERHALTSTDRVLIRDRRPEICGDTVSMNLVLADDIQNVDADIFLMTHTTNPFLSVATLETALERYREGLQAGTADSLFTVNKMQTRFYRQDGSPVNHDPANLVRTQDLEPWFEENSNLYVFSKASFARTGARIGLRPILLEMSKAEAVDIDDQADWQLAAAIAEQRRK
ncbi:MAG: acylneuraminate cytidylyltransferase family protein [Steroidobacteraceae bacterium]